MVHIGLQILQHGGQGVVVGSDINIECATEEMVVAVGNPELIGAGNILSFEVVGGAVETMFLVHEAVLIHARREVEVILHKAIGSIHLGFQLRGTVQPLVGEEDITFVLGVLEREPFVLRAVGIVFPLKPREGATLEGEGQSGGVAEGVGMGGQVDAQIGGRLGSLIVAAVARDQWEA